MRRVVSSHLVGAALILALATPAAAQEDEPEPGIHRSGFVAGVQGGWGMFTEQVCDECAGYFAGWFGFHLGAMIGSRVALLAGVEWGGQGGRFLLSMQALARVFLAGRWWADAGVGGARVDADYGDGDKILHTGISFHLAAGHDIYQGDAFAFDASLRSVWARTGSSGGVRERDDVAVSFQLGLKWY